MCAKQFLANTQSLKKKNGDLQPKTSQKSIFDPVPKSPSRWDPLVKKNRRQVSHAWAPLNVGIPIYSRKSRKREFHVMYCCNIGGGEEIEKI